MEAKDVGKSLDEAERSEQLKRYLSSLPNIILTDYLEFRWYVDGELCRPSARLGTPTKEGKIKRDKAGVQAVAELLNEFLAHKAEAVGTPKELAKQMARLAHRLRDLVTAAFQRKLNLPSLGNLYKAFCDTLAPEVDDLAQLLAQADMSSVLKDFGKRTAKEDPVVHFYETFLAEYDPKVREMRGVYYTLDPAVGTAPFLYLVINEIHEAMLSQKQKGMWNDYVAEKLLPRIFGFELLMAPYAVAHLKLGLLLQETGYQFKSDQRLGIYLTNTLEETTAISANK